MPKSAYRAAGVARTAWSVSTRSRHRAFASGSQIATAATLAIGLCLGSLASAFAQTSAPPQPSDGPGTVGGAATPPNEASATPGAASADAASANSPQAAPLGASAPAGAAATLQEVVVTAEKRSTNLQSTPISVTALTAATLQQEQVRTLTDAQSLVPSLRVGEAEGYAQISLRGIGSSNFSPGAESPVAVNLNEVYVSRPIAQTNSLYDLADIEVLRGPQGTLYGRNATAGAVNITTARPGNDWAGYVRAVGGNYDEFNVEGAVGGPIIADKLSVRVAAFEEQHSGYGRNLVTGDAVDDKDAYGARITIVATPTQDLKATLIGEYYQERDNGAALHFFGAGGLVNLPGAFGISPLFAREGGYTVVDSQNIATQLDPKFRLRTDSLTGILDWKHGPFSVRSITGYRSQASETLTDTDGGSVLNSFVLDSEPDNQFDEELQAHYDTNRAHVTGGLYYFTEQDVANAIVPFTSSSVEAAFGLPVTSPAFLDEFGNLSGTIKTSAKAVFAQGTFDLFGGLSLTAGIRYSDESKQLFSRYHLDVTLSEPYQLNPSNPLLDPLPQPPSTPLPKVTFTATTPKLGLEYKLDPRSLAYFTYSQGFKSGGYDPTSTSPAFAPEKLTDYEGGLKTTLFDRRLRVNVSGFLYDYTDLQVQQVVGLQIITDNAATARIYGSELEIAALPVTGLEIDVNGSFLHARYDNYVGVSSLRSGSVNFTGQALNNAPNFQGYIAGQYSRPVLEGKLAFRAEMNYSSRYYFTPDNVDLLSQGAFAKADLFLTYTSARNWHISAFVRNLTDLTTKVSGIADTSILGVPVQGAVAPPRTEGVEVGYKF